MNNQKEKQKTSLMSKCQVKNYWFLLFFLANGCSNIFEINLMNLGEVILYCFYSLKDIFLCKSYCLCMVLLICLVFLLFH